MSGAVMERPLLVYKMAGKSRYGISALGDGDSSFSRHTPAQSRDTIIDFGDDGDKPRIPGSVKRIASQVHLDGRIYVEIEGEKHVAAVADTYRDAWFAALAKASPMQREAS